VPKRHTLLERLRYRFDNTLARGPIALIAWLALATVALVTLAILIDLAIGGVSQDQGLGPMQVAWSFLFQALVPNPPGSFDSPWQFLVLMLLITVASLGIVSILIGLASATIQNRVETLRRGRSHVIESGHTVILGWSEQIFAIVSELVIAHKNRPHAAIVILGDMDRVEMEDELRHRVPSTRGTRVVCRRGDPASHVDLAMVSVQTSRSILIISDGDEHPDAMTIKTMLAITKAPDRRPEPYLIAAVIRQPRNLAAAQLVGGGEAELVQSGDVIARIMAQTCRQTGLSAVYTDFLDFAGDEIYFQAEPALVGKTYGEALLSYEDSAVMGIYTSVGTPRLNPPMDTVIDKGDQIIAVSEDSDTVRLRPASLGPVAIEQEAIETAHPSQRLPERTLILGWNWRAPAIIKQLDAYVAPGSELTVVAKHDTVEAEITALQEQLPNLTVTLRVDDITSRPVLDSLDIRAYNHVVVLCYSDTFDHQQADAIALLALLHLRQIADECGYAISIVSEMMDARDRDLAESARPDDFIVSDRLVSLMLAQIAENRALNTVFSELLDPGGSDIFLRPAADYVKAGVPVSFYTVVDAARRRGHTAIGYRLQDGSAGQRPVYHIMLNPDKSVPVTFGVHDRLIVLAGQ
jgi:voltage-gated potassium channel Kch